MIFMLARKSIGFGLITVGKYDSYNIYNIGIPIPVQQRDTVDPQFADSMMCGNPVNPDQIISH